VVDITEGVPKNGIIIVNTTDSPEQLRQKMGLTDRKIFTVDATGISTKIMGRNVPNTPMVGAVVKVSGAVKLDSVIRNFQQEFSHKFKEEVIRTNIEAIKLAYEQTKGEGQ
ncbi:MAG: 2-oxoacid:acceptor oxidoreductase family protein, partial [Candidatus Omnitrophica bacterium]|nr:2-oxoacid:acceptor oxidoreductase family protein [Candidatus Omnitrophota bacterium]